jgi:hypothetical protein
VPANATSKEGHHDDLVRARVRLRVRVRDRDRVMVMVRNRYWDRNRVGAKVRAAKTTIGQSIMKVSLLT